MTDMLSSGNGAFSWNSTMSGRHDTCGMTRTPRACSAADCSRTARCPSGPSMPPRSAVQLTGRWVRSWMAANWSRKSPGPMVACMTPPAASPRQPASVSISRHDATRLGTGRPAQPTWVGDFEVAKPRAPARSASRTRPRIAAISSSLASRSVASSPMT